MEFVRGEFGLYNYVQNNPIKRIDPLGLESATVTLNLPYNDPYTCASNVSDAIWMQAVSQGWNKNDKRVHCVVSCEIGRKCGSPTGFFAGLAREAYQLTWKRYIFVPEKIIDSMSDEGANLHGLTCPTSQGCYQRCAVRY